MTVPDSTLAKLRGLALVATRAAYAASSAAYALQSAVDGALAEVGSVPGQGIDLDTGEILNPPPPSVRVG